MIPKHIKREPKNDNYRALAIYVADAKSGGSPGEKTLMRWHDGCMAEDYLCGMIEVEATQAMNTRTEQEKTYHLMVSFRPEDEAKLTSEIFKAIEKEFAKVLGYSEYQRHCGVHKNTDNLHMHIAYNMIHPETFNRHEPFRDYPKLHRKCRELEKIYGLKIDKGIDENAPRKTTKTNIKAQDYEAHHGQESFFTYVAKRKDFILETVGQTNNWRELHEVFLKRGLELKLRGNGFVIKDRFGKHHVPPSHIDRSLSKSELEKKFGPFISPAQEQLLIKANEKYNASPTHQNPHRDNLYTQFQTEMKQRKAALEAVKETEKHLYETNKNKWMEKRELLKNYAMLPAERQRLLQQIKTLEHDEIIANRVTLNEQRKAIRTSMPYTSWTKFLQHKAVKGNETALEILRSKKLQPELAKAYSNNKFLSDLEVNKSSRDKQNTIWQMQGINKNHKRALVAVVKMQELFSKEKSLNFDDISYKIDTKGTVIFSLKSGGTIRDTGIEIHFSSHDKVSGEIAKKYAKMKWGKQVLYDNNTLKFIIKCKRLDPIVQSRRFDVGRLPG